MNHKQQVIHIHGGEPWNSYEDYLDYLKTKKVKPQHTFLTERWHYNYMEFLDGSRFEVLRPDMPCKQNAHYSEWEIWFERHIPFLRDGVILVGHSLGGNFLAKYLAEKDFKLNIKQLHLVAPSYNFTKDDFNIIEFPENFSNNNIDEIHIYHSHDDTVVPISESKKYHAALPESQLHIFDDRFHFLDETFPELFENIRSISDE